jgi:hypothetical protein
MIPYVFPEKVSQVFFVDDSSDSSLKVVLRHEPRGIRITEETDVPVFGAPGPGNAALSLPLFNHGRGISPIIPGAGSSRRLPFPEGDVLQREFVEVLDANVRNPESDDHIDDVDYEDEPDLVFGDGEALQ